MENEPKQTVFLQSTSTRKISILCRKQFFHRFELVDQQRMADNPKKPQSMKILLFFFNRQPTADIS